MLKHDDVWRGIDRLASSYGYSASGLAKKAGLDPTSFNKSKRRSPDGKPRWPSTESISKILAVTGATMTDFIDLIGIDDRKTAQRVTRKIPVIGFAQAGRSGHFDQDGFPAGSSWDEVSFPSGKKDSDNAYGLRVTGSSMEPLYRAGDLLVVSPAASIHKGDRIVIRTTEGEVMVKELQKQHPAKIELRSLNPAHKNINLPRKDISWMARILWVSQ